MIDFGEEAFSIATIDDQIGDSDKYGETMGIQRKVAKWITHEYNPCLPMVHVQMDATESANTVRVGKHSKLTGLTTFFRRLREGMMRTGILDLAMGHFLKIGFGIPTGQPSGKVVGMPDGHVVRAT